MIDEKIILKTESVCRDFLIGDGSVVHALNNVSADIQKGKLTVFRGRSGSGKTTLINIMGALDNPTSGKVWFCGEEISSYSPKEQDALRRNKMAFVFQSVALVSTMTALENVELSLRLAGFPASERTERAKEVLTLVGLEKRMKHMPAQMSGGEQQRVAIARAMAPRPEIIFADEPTAELDSTTGLSVVKLFKEIIAKENLTVVMTTHDPKMFEICDYLYTLKDGEIVERTD